MFIDYFFYILLANFIHDPFLLVAEKPRLLLCHMTNHKPNYRKNPKFWDIHVLA